MKAYKSTTEHAREIREAYKVKGWNSRMIGVRSEYFSMGSSIDVTVKSPEVDFTEAEKIAKDHDRIDRCSVTGDILSGCNRYVHVSYSGECRRLMGEPFEDRIIDAFVALTERSPTDVHESISETEVTLSLENPHTVRIWDGHRARGSFYGMTPGGIKDGAFQVAILDREMKAYAAARDKLISDAAEAVEVHGEDELERFARMEGKKP